MENWYVDSVSGMQIHAGTTPDDNWWVGIPSRGILVFTPDEVEHVYVRPTLDRPNTRTIAGNP